MILTSCKDKKSMCKDQDTLMFIVCVWIYICVLYREIRLNANLFLQVAVTAGENLLTSVSTFEKSHCVVQDITISEFESHWGGEIYFIK